MTPVTIYHTLDSSVYPGGYEPPPWIGKGITAHKGQDVYSVKPRLRLEETSDLFKVEVAAPGFNREDFFVRSARGRLLIIACSHEKSVINEDQGNTTARYRYLKKEVDLPGNVDTNFVTAEYKNGTLCFCFSKSQFPAKAVGNAIIVY